MGEKTSISWTDHTFNCWIGCTKVHEGCAHCYAESLSKRTGKALWGPAGSRVVTSPKYWQQPLKWDREAQEAGERRRVFCASMADVFEGWTGNMLTWERDKESGENTVLWHRDDIGPCTAGQTTVNHSRGERLATMSDVRAKLFALIDATPNLDWLLLTKRPENIRRMWCSHVNTDGLPPSKLHRENVWLGTSISNQETAEKLIPELLKSRHLAPVLFLSAEPLLGPIDLTVDGLSCSECRHCADQAPDLETNVVECRHCEGTGKSDEVAIDWVIAGGESGGNARPMHPQWARDLRDQCAAAGVAFHFKQWGEHMPWDHRHSTPEQCQQTLDKVKLATRMMPDGTFPSGPMTREQVDEYMTRGVHMVKVGKAAAGRLLDGRTHDEFPQVAAV